MSRKKQSKKRRKNKKCNKNGSTGKLIQLFVWIVGTIAGVILTKLPYIEDFINWIVKLLSFNY